MFPIVAAIFAFIIGGIICPIRVNIDAKLRGTFCKADVKLRIFYALVPLKISFKLNFTPFGGFYAVASFAGGKTDVIYPPKRRRKRIFDVKPLLRDTRWLEASRLDIGGAVGFSDNACYTVMLAGILNAIFDAMCCICFPKRGKNGISVAFIPEFGMNTFRINLEGIFHILIPQIIAVFIKNSVMKGRMENAPD